MQNPVEPLSREEQGVVWDYFKPRHTQAWNMLVLSWSQLANQTELGFETEYYWENFVIRLWLYRTAVKILTRFPVIERDANGALHEFDGVFSQNGENQLSALRDMVEHLDDNAVDERLNVNVRRERDLDPWRTISPDRFERGRYCLDRETSYAAADKLRSEVHRMSSTFVRWYKSLD